MSTEHPSLPRHTEAMLRLARMDKSDLEVAFRAITRTVSEVLDVERVGVWLFDEDRAAIHCVDLFVRSEDRHDSGQCIGTESYPAYFRALAESRTIEAEDAQHDPRTRELAESYLRPLGITSMLDVPCWRGGQVAAIVCQEHVGPMRRWSSQDRGFAASVADMVSLALEADERRRIGEQREQLLEQLGRERRLLEQVLEQMPAGVLLVNPSGETLLQNERARDMLGTAMPGQVREWIEHALEGAPRVTGEEIAVTGASGDELWLSINAGSVRDESSAIVAAVAAFADITERRRNARELVEEGRFRDQFMAVLGHDLRTPATAVSMSAQLLQRTTLDPHQRGLVDRILSSTRRMDRMISELLDLARISGGRITLGRRDLDLRDLCNEVLAELQVAWPDRTIAVHCEGDLRGEWDQDRLAQVMSNLIGNALAHGSAEASVDVRLEGHDDEVAMAVHNRGAPIPGELLQHIFEPFRGAQQGRRGAHAGLGLGLFITRAIVEAHAGRVQAQSDERGTTFTVWLPRCPAEGASRNEPTR